MAKNFIFTVDASKIIAKLHLAARTAAGLGKDAMFINTGVVNDDPSATADKPGKVAFNLDNSTNKYQVAYALDVDYFQSFDAESFLDEMTKLASQLAGKDSKLDDKQKEDVQEKFKTATTKFVNALTSTGKAFPKETKLDLENPDPNLLTNEDTIKALKDAIAKATSEDKASYEKMMDAAKKSAIEKLNPYLTTFIGEKSFKKISEDDLTPIPISNTAKGPDDKKLVANFEIQQIPQQEKEKMLATFKATFMQAIDGGKAKDKNFKNCKQKYAFTVGYTLTVDK